MRLDSSFSEGGAALWITEKGDLPRALGLRRECPGELTGKNDSYWVEQERKHIPGKTHSRVKFWSGEGRREVVAHSRKRNWFSRS